MGLAVILFAVAVMLVTTAAAAFVIGAYFFNSFLENMGAVCCALGLLCAGAGAGTLLLFWAASVGFFG